MPIRSARVLTCLLLAAGTLTAQNVIVVDRNGGGAFFDIPQAVAAAAPGDILDVRPGQYSPFRLDKPLHVLGSPGVSIIRQQIGVVVSSIAQGQHVVIRGLTFDNASFILSLLVVDCAGAVVVEDASAGRVTVRGSAQVALRNLTLAGPLEVTDANSTIVGGSMLGGLVCERSRVVVHDAVCQGSANLGAAPPGAEVRSGRLLVAGDAATRIAAGLSFSGSPGSAVMVAAGAELVIDPAVTLVPANGAPPIQGQALVTPLVALTASRSGSTLTARTYAAGGSQAFLLIGLLRQPVLVLPLPFQDLWLGDAHVVLDAGPITANGTRIATSTLPPLPLGLPLALQSIVLRGGGVELSNGTAVSF